MQTSTDAGPFLIPPHKVVLAGGSWKLPESVALTGPDEDTLSLQKTATLLKSLGISTSIVSGGARADIVVVRRAGDPGSEAYEIQVGSAGVTVSASSAAGAFYGCATLRELIRRHKRALPTLNIEDAPTFRRRGVYHDTARGKVPRLETLKGLVDKLAEWKINELQLYVENAFQFKKHPLIWEGYSPLTAAELTELREYCSARYVRLVPSLSSFGHMEKVLCLPDYAHLNEVPYGSTLCPVDPRSAAFIAELYDEYLPLFEKGDFNVCCDETWDLGKGRSAARCEEIGVGGVYLEFLLKIRELCASHGFRMNAWADIVLEHPDLIKSAPRDVVMLNWDYDAAGKRIPRTREIAEAGYDFVVCPGVGSWRSMGTRWPEAHRNIRNFAGTGAEYGTLGLLNTDWGDFSHRQPLAVSLMGFAFGAAESWNPGAADADEFHREFALQAYGADDSVGEAILALARIDEVAKIEPAGGKYSRLYFNLDQDLTGSDNDIFYSIHRGIDKRSPELLDAILDMVPADKTWKATGTDTFDRLSMAEYAMVGQLTGLYCRRSSAAWRLGMGEKVTPAELSRLADETDRVSTDYAELWLQRNKRSRLDDILSLFRRASADARSLADNS